MKRSDRTGQWICQNTTISGTYPNQILKVTGQTGFSDYVLGGDEAQNSPIGTNKKFICTWENSYNYWYA